MSFERMVSNSKQLLAFSETYAPIGKQHTKQFKEMEATFILAGMSLLNPIKTLSKILNIDPSSIFEL